MTSPHLPAAADSPPPGAGAPGVALAVTAVLATVGSFAVGFGVLTTCTNEYRCTVTACAPCATADDWLTAGWIGQALLLLTAGVLVLAAHRVRPRPIRVAALWLTGLSLALFVVTTVLATQSF